MASLRLAMCTNRRITNLVHADFHSLAALRAAASLAIHVPSKRTMQLPVPARPKKKVSIQKLLRFGRAVQMGCKLRRARARQIHPDPVLSPPPQVPYPSVFVPVNWHGARRIPAAGVGGTLLWAAVRRGVGIYMLKYSWLSTGRGDVGVDEPGKYRSTLEVCLIEGSGRCIAPPIWGRCKIMDMEITGTFGRSVYLLHELLESGCRMRICIVCSIGLGP